MKKTTLIFCIFIIAFFAIGIFSYFNLSVEEVATHWNASGEVDGYMSKFWGVFFIPVLSVGLLVFFVIIPKIDPKGNIKKFQKYYDSFILVFMTYMLYVYALTILSNFGFSIEMGTAIMTGLGGLFIYIGYLMKNLKQNWFIGIRTPWTLSSEKVWKKTHEVGSKLFMFLGIAFFATIFIPENLVLFFILVPTISVSVGLLVYSWWIWKKLKLL